MSQEEFRDILEEVNQEYTINWIARELYLALGPEKGELLIEALQKLV